MYAARKTTLGPAKVSEILKSWQEYPAVLSDESLRQICSVASYLQMRKNAHLRSYSNRWSVATGFKFKSWYLVQVHRGHIEQLFTWLSGCCTLRSLGYRHKHALLLCFAIVTVMFGCFGSVVNFWTTCWHTNLVWASLYVGQNFTSQGMLFVNVNKYSSTINRKI